MILYYCPRCDDCVEPATDDRGRDVVRVVRSGLVVRELECGDVIRKSAPPASVGERLLALGLALDDAGMLASDDDA